MKSIITLVIPCYKVKNKILDVIRDIGNEVDKIIIVDDSCPENTGEYVKANCIDDRIEVVYNESNLGVGGATKTGFQYALKLSSDIIVKMDGDGQMDPKQITHLVGPLLDFSADFVKGNRFYDYEYLAEMPLIRKIGNSILSFINKMVSGYWNIMDPTNGFFAINSNVLKLLKFKKINDRFFFESDLIFNLGLISAVIKDIPIKAKYSDERSNISIHKIILTFPIKYVNRLIKRIIYKYFIRDFNVATVELFFGVILFSFGFIFGAIKWIHSITSNTVATAGTVILATLPIILGFQLFLSFVNYDIQNVPENPLSKNIKQG